MPENEETKSVPEWVEKTPDETTYTLTMFGVEGGNIQQIELARAEYLALKQALARMRGYLKGEN